MSRELENWLRYYKDLGFTHVYRREPPAGSRHENPQISQRTQMLKERSQESEVRSQKAEGASQSVKSAKSADSVPQPADLLAAAAPRETLEAVREDLGDCKRCKLCKTRKTIVFGSGNPHAELVFVGEGPGADEDAQGLPFVGRAGQLLTEMIEKGMKIPRPDVYICNIVKCRPPENRKPEKDEVAACRQFMERQIDAIRPRVICALGATAAETMLEMRESMGKLRGRWFEFRGIPLVVTYHPAYLLRDPTKKRETWEDLKLILARLGSPAEPRGKSS
jgi:uracil-DNA glycosylase family 4